MSCAIEDCYIGQFPLKFCQVTVIKLKALKKWWDLPALHCMENLWKQHLLLMASLSVLVLAPETGSEVASDPLCRWGWPWHADPSAPASPMIGLWVPATRLSYTFCQVFLMTLCQAQQNCYSYLTSVFKNNSALFCWLNFKTQCDFYDGCNPSPQSFCYLLDHSMSHTLKA